MAKRERTLLGELALMMSLERTVHYALVSCKLLGPYFLRGHVLLCWHVLQRRSNKSIALPTALGVLSL